MTYAKLIEGGLIFAPNPIKVGDNYLGNPPGSVYEAEGYKTVTYTNPPGEPDEGYQWESKWVETSETILQGWEQEKIPDDIDPAEAMEILFGGYPDTEV